MARRRSRCHRIQPTIAKTYVVSSGTVPTDGAAFMNGASCNNCAFIKWGWWGTQADLTDGGSNQAQASTHLGTWVAGNVSTRQQLIDAGYNDPSLNQGSLAPSTKLSATYAGQAIGTVNNNGAQYVAGGSVNMDWNFGDRTGTLGRVRL